MFYTELAYIQNVTSHSAFCLNIHAADLPRITSHPQEINDAVPGKPVIFTIQVTGTQPLTYWWQWKPAEEGSSSQEWQECDAERFPDASSPKLTISSVQKLDEGSYRCVVSNCAGIETSKPASLSVGKINFWSEVKSFHYVVRS